jgi:hypothetical protein
MKLTKRQINFLVLAASDLQEVFLEEDNLDVAREIREIIDILNQEFETLKKNG